MLRASRGATGDIREATRPKQRTSQSRTPGTIGTRPDEQFPEGPNLGRWESIYKYTSKYTRYQSLI
jgi:hypothetical protein